MSKKLIFILFLPCGIAFGQNRSAVINVSSDPGGACSPAGRPADPLEYNITNGKLWGCKAHVWTLITGAGLGGTVTSVALSKTDDTNVTATITGSPITTAGTINVALGWTGLLAAARMVNAGVFTGDAATTFPALTIANSAITNAKLANASTTVNGTTCTLGSPCTLPTAFATFQLSATSSDPGCTVAGDLGKFWIDSTSAVTTHFKVCVDVISVPTWVSVI